MRKCRFCKTEIPPKKLADRWQAAGFCNLDHMAEYGKQKALEQRERQQRKAIKEKKEKLKTKSDKLRELQTIVNQYIRLRDQGLPCISCGKLDNGTHQRHASHYRSVGSNSFLRFNTHNIHASCAQCNTYKSGAIGDYRIGLIQRYGVHIPEMLENAPRSRTYSDEWIERAKKIFRRKIRLYKRLRDLQDSL